DLIGSENHALKSYGPYQKNIDYVALIWEDFMYQANNREISSARKEHMPYPRFTKVIINHFISKENTISMRNRINLHTVYDDTLLGTLKFVSKRRIITITSVKVMRWYDYGYLEEIVVRRDDNVLYKFKEDDWSDLGVALRMLTKRIVILHRDEAGS
nr:hypothetical protein [Tanacetum cinerariifolium]